MYSFGAETQELNSCPIIVCQIEPPLNGFPGQLDYFLNPLIDIPRGEPPSQASLLCQERINSVSSNNYIGQEFVPSRYYAYYLFFIPEEVINPNPGNYHCPSLLHLLGKPPVKLSPQNGETIIGRLIKTC